MMWSDLHPKTQAVIKEQLRRIFRSSREKAEFLTSVTIWTVVNNRKRAWVDCVHCNKRLGKSTIDYNVDHIVPVGNPSSDMIMLMFDRDNLQVLCKDCHDKKTKQDLQDIKGRSLL